MKRIIVTGSRHWKDVATIDAALYRWWWNLAEGGEEVVLVHGECHLGGADIIARDIWRSHGLRDEPHPADWKQWGKAAGPRRNREMCELGADILLAFPLEGSQGTQDCIRWAHQLAIPTEIHRSRI